MVLFLIVWSGVVKVYNAFLNIFNLSSHEPQESLPNNSNEQALQPAQPISAAQLHVAQAPIIHQDEDEDEFQRLQNQAMQSQRENFSRRIPMQYDNQSLFFFRCDISKRSIRHIVVPREEDAQQVQDPTYEKEEIENWIREKPHQLPPNWPAHILPTPLRIDYLKPCKIRQKIIETAINKLLAA